jgi:hypothetical protein
VVFSVLYCIGFRAFEMGFLLEVLGFNAYGYLALLIKKRSTLDGCLTGVGLGV